MNVEELATRWANNEGIEEGVRQWEGGGVHGGERMRESGTGEMWPLRRVAGGTCRHANRTTCEYGVRTCTRR